MRGGSSSPSCRRHSVNTNGVQWPYHFPKADDGPVLTILYIIILLDFSLTVKAVTLIFIFGCGSAISSAKEGISGFIYNLAKS